MKSKFICAVRSPIEADRDKFLSTASIQEIKSLLPNVNTIENSDLLAIAFDACIVNKFNKNDDGIDSTTAVSIAKNFVFKPINIEHKQTNIAGVILSASFTSLDEHKPLTEEEALASKDPYYITLGGVVWRSIKPELASYLEECADPESPDYEAVSASWELGFDSYSLALKSDNSRLFSGAEIISEAGEVQKIESCLRANGGTGKYNNKRVYRIVNAGVLPMGIGLTENPAADVSGVCVETENKSEASVSSIDANEIIQEIGSSHTNIVINPIKTENNISISTKKDVIEERDTTMKLQKLDQITDEYLKNTATASSVVEFINEQIKIANDDYVAKMNQANEFKTKAEAEINKLKDDCAKASKDFEALKIKFDEMVTAQNAAKSQQDFNVRMEYFTKNFELTEDSKKVIAKELATLANEEEFNAYLDKMKALLPAKGLSKSTASTVTTNTDSTSQEKVIEDSLKNATQTIAKVPNTTSTTEQSLVEKYAKAFAPSEVLIKMGRKSR